MAEDFFAGEIHLGDASGLPVAAAAALPEAAVGKEEKLLAVLVA